MDHDQECLMRDQECPGAVVEPLSYEIVERRHRMVQVVTRLICFF
jgi:hypothetical protein